MLHFLSVCIANVFLGKSDTYGAPVEARQRIFSFTILNQHNFFSKTLLADQGVEKHVIVRVILRGRSSDDSPTVVWNDSAGKYK